MKYIFFDEIQMVSQFQKVIDNLFLIDNIGNITSTKRIGDSLTSAGYKTSVHTVDNDPAVSHNGIQQLYAINWLLQ